ncbi:MAG: hypothetical protein LBC33_02725 [Mycoplasmataceae bacterium]|jgi:hypothetical protein|nr:hypothetical protein [Mycoplasmataceae bacterium]
MVRLKRIIIWLLVICGGVIAVTAPIMSFYRQPNITIYGTDSITGVYGSPTTTQFTTSYQKPSWSTNDKNFVINSDGLFSWSNTLDVGQYTVDITCKTSIFYGLKTVNVEITKANFKITGESTWNVQVGTDEYLNGGRLYYRVKADFANGQFGVESDYPRIFFVDIVDDDPQSYTCYLRWNRLTGFNPPLMISVNLIYNHQLPNYNIPYKTISFYIVPAPANAND